MTQTAGLVVKTGGFYDTNRRFGRKNSLRIFATKDFVFRRKILSPLKFYDTNRRFGCKNSLRIFMTQIKDLVVKTGGFYDTNRGLPRDINPTICNKNIS